MLHVRAKGAMCVLLGLLLGLAACAPAAVPTPTPTKPPAAAFTKQAEPTKPPAPPAAQPAAPTPTPEPAKVKFGATPSSADAGVLAAIEKGYFREQGINVETVEFRAVSEMIGPISTGQVDIIGVSLGAPVLNAIDRGVALKIVADKGSSQPRFEQSYIVLRKDLADSGQVKTAADLKGMKVAIPSPGAIGDQTVRLMLAEGGVARDVEVIVLPFPEMMAAFANKGIAASFEVEPYTTQGIQQGLFVKWKPASSFFGGKVQTTAIVYSPGLASNRDLGQRWMVGYLKGIRYYLKALTTGEGWDEVVAILTRYTPVKDPALYKLMELPYLDPNGGLDTKSLDAQHRFFVESGSYTGKKSFDDAIDTSFAEYAVQKLGRQ